MAEFDEKIGIGYLRGMHINDSKTELGSKRDRHENIGLYVLVHPFNSPTSLPSASPMPSGI
jgi:AP endonuclease-1